MKNNKITLKEAEKFHGHLGPWLILGVRAGEFALKKLRCKKFFDIEVKVRGASEKPRSCLIDGLQLSTGATYGKGNIKKLKGSKIKIEFYNRFNHKEIDLGLKNKFIKELNFAKTHDEAENLVKKIYRINPKNLFTILK